MRPYLCAPWVRRARPVRYAVVNPAAGPEVPVAQVRKPRSRAAVPAQCSRMISRAASAWPSRTASTSAACCRWECSRFRTRSGMPSSRPLTSARTAAYRAVREGEPHEFGEGEVEEGVLAAVLLGRGVAGALQRLAQPPGPGRVEAVRRAESGRAHLQDLAEPQGVLQRRRVGPPGRRVRACAGRADERTAVPPASRLHQPLVLKGLQDLAQRHAAHPDPLGQLPLRGQPLARRDQAQADHLEDLFHRLLEAVARPHRPEHRGEAVVARPRRAVPVRAPRRRARVSHPAVPLPKQWSFPIPYGPR